jgi:UDP-N-acetylmuramoyl-tripeptide--D-alanyl-D-alanine ligase
MIRMALEEAARLLGAPVPDQAGLEFCGVAIDSRALQPGMLFAALPGERVDGHDFAQAAASAGAAAILCSKPLPGPLPQLLVADVQQALGQLAAAWRARMPARVIGITGSNGKTTTKDMLTSILALEARVLSTSGNYNNELGVPLTLFGLDESHQFMVLEMGAGKAGDIRYLAAIAKPEVGVITSVGPAHLDGFGDEQGVARAKGEMYEALPAEGFAVLNMDEPWLPVWRELAGERRALGFGLNPQADVHLAGTAEKPRVVTPKGEFDLVLHLPGQHNQMNAMAATAMALALGIGLAQISKGLARALPVPGRLNMLHTEAGWTVMDDTYNANPASLYAALQVLSSEPGERWLVLGDMLELGEGARKLHAEMGEAAAALGVKRLFTYGPLSAAASDAFGSKARHFSDQQALVSCISEQLHPGVVCLVKGSRSMHMERVVAAISSADPAAEVA